MTERRLNVSINERPVGCLREADDVWAFDYDPAWSDAGDGFDLSPALPRSRPSHLDGASLRPVQWYFDNLLPEEALRTVLAREARVHDEDAFGLLAYFGAESAGSLVLGPRDGDPSAQTGLQELSDEALSARIGNLPRLSLSHDAPKHMSLAGAQHKLAVVYRDGRLFEPLPGEASTHILKPNHPEAGYPASVINEYFVMRLARALDLPVPHVHRRYTPHPVYIVDRFDRAVENGRVLRRHMIDACQLLNKPRGFKYRSATLETLAQVILQCRTRPKARLWLFQWLVFNALVGNADNHLKNISFMVSEEGIDISPGYDLISTAVYSTADVAGDPARAAWPRVELALPLPGAAHFSEISRRTLLEAGAALGLAQATVARELDRLVTRIIPAAGKLLEQIEAENRSLPEAARPFLAGEMRLLRALTHIVIREMAAKMRDAAGP
jgi:serine/threonine-protein kinase HipA